MSNQVATQRAKIDTIKKDMTLSSEQYKRITQIQQKDKADKDKLIKITEQIFMKKAKIQNQLKNAQQQNGVLKERLDSYLKELQHLRMHQNKNYALTQSLQEKIKLLQLENLQKDKLLQKSPKTLDHNLQTKHSEHHQNPQVDELKLRLSSTIQEIKNLNSKFELKLFQLNSERQRSASKDQQLGLLSTKLILIQVQHNSEINKKTQEFTQKIKKYEQSFKEMDKQLKQKIQKNKNLIADNLNLRKYFQIMKKQYSLILITKNQQLKQLKRQFSLLFSQNHLKQSQISPTLKKYLEKQIKQQIQFSHNFQQKQTFDKSQLKQQQKQLIRQFKQQIQKLTLVIHQKQKLIRELQSKLNLDKLEEMIKKSNLENAMVYASDLEEKFKQKQIQCVLLKSKYEALGLENVALNQKKSSLLQEIEKIKLNQQKYLFLIKNEMDILKKSEAALKLENKALQNKNSKV